MTVISILGQQQLPRERAFHEWPDGTRCNSLGSWLQYCNKVGGWLECELLYSVNVLLRKVEYVQVFHWFLRFITTSGVLFSFQFDEINVSATREFNTFSFKWIVLHQNANSVKSTPMPLKKRREFLQFLVSSLGNTLDNILFCVTIAISCLPYYSALILEWLTTPNSIWPVPLRQDILRSRWRHSGASWRPFKCCSYNTTKRGPELPQLNVDAEAFEFSDFRKNSQGESSAVMALIDV